MVSSLHWEQPTYRTSPENWTFYKDNHILIEADTSTPLPGLFAAGDCTGGVLEFAKAVYEGALAGTRAVDYLKSKK